MTSNQHCPNCGEAGHPDHHVLEGFGYVCFGKDSSIPAVPTTDEEFSDLPILDMNEFDGK